MKNKQYKRLIDKSLKLVIATIFSFSLVNSTLVAKLTDIDEFGSVAFAGKSKEEKAAEKAAKAEAKAEKAAEKAAEKGSNNGGKGNGGGKGKKNR